jgi:phage FluMu protein Com
MAPSEASQQLRCACGNLLAKATERGIELQCRRCKRIVVVPYDQLAGREELVQFVSVWAAEERHRRP